MPLQILLDTWNTPGKETRLREWEVGILRIPLYSQWDASVSTNLVAQNFSPFANKQKSNL